MGAFPSPRFNTLTVNSTASFGGATTFSGTLTIISSGNANIELGRIDGTTSTPFIDFHSGATSTDYDARIIASGGNGFAGNGSLTYTASGGHLFNTRPTFAGNIPWDAGNFNPANYATLNSPTFTSGATSPTFTANSGTGYQIRSTGNGTDQNNTDIILSGGVLSFRLINDAYSAANTWMSVSRSGYNLTAVAINIRPTFAGNLALDVGNFPQSYNQTLRNYNPTVDGSADARSAFASAESAFGSNEIFVPAGTYLVSSNITLNAHYRFARGAVLKPANGVVVTFSGGLTAGEYKIFDTSLGGSIAGLNSVNVEWFTSLAGTTTNCIADIQKAYDACAYGAVVTWPAKSYCIGGDVPILVAKAQDTRGAGASGTFLRCLTSKRYAFKVQGGQYARISGFFFDAQDGSVIATEGVYVDCLSNFTRLSSFSMNNAWIGARALNSNGHRIVEFDIGQAVYAGLWVEAGNDTFVDNWLITATADFFIFSGVTGSFVNGETITFGGGNGTGVIVSLLSPTKALVQRSRVNPPTGVTVTGGTSGATATLQSITEMHQLGGIRLNGFVEAFTATNGDLIGGRYNITSDSTGSGRGAVPAFCKFTNIYCDTSKLGVFYNNSIAFKHVNCWFASSAQHNVQTQGTLGMKFIGCENTNALGNGFQFSATCKNFAVQGCDLFNNTQTQINIASGATGFNINDNNFAGGYLGAPQQLYNIIVGANCSEFVISGNNLNGASTASMNDASTTINKVITNNRGYKTSNKVTVTIASGQTLGAAIHGLNYTPGIGDVTITPQANPQSVGVSNLWVGNAPSSTTVYVNANAAPSANLSISVDISPSWSS